MATGSRCLVGTARLIIACCRSWRCLYCVCGCCACRCRTYRCCSCRCCTCIRGRCLNPTGLCGWGIGIYRCYQTTKYQQQNGKRQTITAPAMGPGKRIVCHGWLASLLYRPVTQGCLKKPRRQGQRACHLSTQFFDALSGADHIGHAYTEFFIHHYHFTVRNQGAVHQHIQGLTGQTIQFND